jgi:hypothetical protein
VDTIWCVISFESTGIAVAGVMHDLECSYALSCAAEDVTGTHIDVSVVSGVTFGTEPNRPMDVPDW